MLPGKHFFSRKNVENGTEISENTCRRAIILQNSLIDFDDVKILPSSEAAKNLI